LGLQDVTILMSIIHCGILWPHCSDIFWGFLGWGRCSCGLPFSDIVVGYFCMFASTWWFHTFPAL